MSTKVFLDGAEVFNQSVTIVSGQLVGVPTDRGQPVNGNYAQVDNVVTVDGQVMPGGIVTIRGYNVTVDVPDTAPGVPDSTDSMTPATEHAIEAEVVADETNNDV